MGYYADVGGVINFINPLTPESKEKLAQILTDEWYDEFNFDEDGMTLRFWSGDKYNYDTEEMLNRIAGEFYVIDGCVECHGEDGEHWKFKYVKAIPHGRFKSISGRVVYDDECQVQNGDRTEFLGQLIDTFEDFLEGKGITFPNSEREDSGEDAAIIYGSDYDWIQCGLEETLMRWGVLAPELRW